MKRYLQSTVARNALALYGIQAAQYILPWFTYPYLTRVLHPASWGRLLFAQAFVQFFVVITEYGFNFTATREVAIHRDDTARLSKILTSVTVAKILLMSASLIVMTAISMSVPTLRADLPLFAITFLTVVGNVLFPVWLFQGLEEMQFITFREIAARLIGLLPTFLLVRSESDILWAAGVQSGSVAFAGIIGLFSLPRVTRARFVPVTTSEILGTFKDGWHVFLSTAAITIYTRSNTFILGLMAAPQAVGYYGAALRLVDTAKGLVSPLSTAIFPHVSRLSHEDPEGAVAFLRRHSKRLHDSLPRHLARAGRGRAVDYPGSERETVCTRRSPVDDHVADPRNRCHGDGLCDLLHAWAWLQTRMVAAHHAGGRSELRGVAAAAGVDAPGVCHVHHRNGHRRLCSDRLLPVLSQDSPPNCGGIINPE